MSVEQNERLESKQVAWSMDQDINQKIAEALNKAGDAFLKRDYSDMVTALKNCKSFFIQSLSQEEKNELSNMEKNMQLSLFAFDLNKRKNNWENSMDYDEETCKVYNKIINKYLSSLTLKSEKYREKIMELLDLYGYLSKKKKDKSRMGL